MIFRIVQKADFEGNRETTVYKCVTGVLTGHKKVNEVC